MEMRDRLSGVRTVIGDDPVAAVIETMLGGDARSQESASAVTCQSSLPTSRRAAKCRRGTMSTWTGACGWRSRKATLCSLSATSSVPSSPRAMRQKIQSATTGSVISSGTPNGLATAPWYALGPFSRALEARNRHASMPELPEVGSQLVSECVPEAEIAVAARNLHKHRPTLHHRFMDRGPFGTGRRHRCGHFAAMRPSSNPFRRLLRVPYLPSLRWEVRERGAWSWRSSRS